MGRVGDGTKTTVGKLSYAGWIPHDRGFVLGLPRSKRRASTLSAHNRHEGSPPRSVPNPAHRKDRSNVPLSVLQVLAGVTVRAIAQMKPAISRAIAVVATTFGLPAAIRCR